MNTLLLIGDFTSTTGFGRVNERLLAALDPGEWDIHVLAINASGDYHPLQRRYKSYPAMLGGRDLLGVERAPEVIAHVKPDLIVAHNDAWLTQHYLDAARRVLPDVPFIAYCPPDAPNQHAGKRSEERRVGKEQRRRWITEYEEKYNTTTHSTTSRL